MLVSRRAAYKRTGVTGVFPINEFFETAVTTWEALPFILGGLWLTVQIIFITFGAGFVLGFPIASAQVYSYRPVAVLLFVYERVIRGIPVMFTIFWSILALPTWAWGSVR